MTQEVKTPWHEQTRSFRQQLGLTILDPEVQAFQEEVNHAMRETEAYRIAENQARQNFREGYVTLARKDTNRLARAFNFHVRKAEKNLTRDIESGVLMLHYVDEVLTKQLAATEKQMQDPVQLTALDGKKDNTTLLQLRKIVLDKLSEKPAVREHALKRMTLPPTRLW